MPVDNDGMPAESGPAGTVGFHVVLQHGGIALPQAVHIHDGAEIVETGMSGHFSRLPHRALDGLAVSHQHIGAVIGLIDGLGVECKADSGGQPLAQRTGGHIHEGQTRGRMAFEIGSECAQFQQVGRRKQPGFRPGGIKQGSRMALGENEAIAVRQLRVVGVVPHHREKQGRRDVGRRTATGRMAAAGFTGCFDTVDAELSGLIGQGGQQFRRRRTRRGSHARSFHDSRKTDEVDS